MSYSNHAKISEIRYQPTELSGRGEILTPQPMFTPLINPNNILYRTLFDTFNREQCLYPRLPVDMGNWSAIATQHTPNVLRLPIKNKGATYYVPEELAPLRELLDFVFNYELNINSAHDQTFCHITVDRSKVPAGQHHRFPNFHTDGFQGSRLTPKILPEHSYIFTTSPPTELCLQPFFLQHLDEAKHNMFQEMDRQAKPANIYGTLPGHLYLFDPYIIHRTPEITKDTDRLFIRITYSFSELEHPKNTINPMLPPYQYADRIDIRSNLRPSEHDVPYHFYGVQQ